MALVGDFDAAVVAHQAIPRAIDIAAAAAGVSVDAAWVATDSIGTDGRLDGFDAFWCVPASPYRSTEGALRAIPHARERHRPFLGTCGGFQHAVIEYSRSVLGWSEAASAESSPGAQVQVVTPLECASFFVATLFQPERAALRDEVPPIVRAFVQAAAMPLP